MFYEFKHSGSPDYLKVERGENFNFPLHLHQCFEVIAVLSGEMEIAVEKKKYRLQKGEALLIFPNQIHSLSSTDSSHILCIFSPRLVQAYTTSIAGKRPLDNKFLLDDYLVNAIEQLSMESTTAEKKGALYSLCAKFDNIAEYGVRATDNEKLLFKIFSFVEKEFDGECSLIRLAEETGYAYSYISRYFKRIVGVSFNTYVNYYKLSQACYLMENSDAPILQCAMESGYTSLRSFNRNFKMHFNMTPAEYRKEVLLR